MSTSEVRDQGPETVKIDGPMPDPSPSGFFFRTKSGAIQLTEDTTSGAMLTPELREDLARAETYFSVRTRDHVLHAPLPTAKAARKFGKILRQYAATRGLSVGRPKVTDSNADDVEYPMWWNRQIEDPTDDYSTEHVGMHDVTFRFTPKRVNQNGEVTITQTADTTDGETETA